MKSADYMTDRHTVCSAWKWGHTSKVKVIFFVSGPKFTKSFSSNMGKIILMILRLPADST